MRGIRQFVLTVAGVFLLLALCPSILAQPGAGRNRWQARREARRGQRAAPGREGRQILPKAGRMAGLPPRWVERLQEMSPQDQQRFMQNNARFRSLPPERQEQMRKNLQRWNQLSPAARQALRRRERIFARLTPQERQEVVRNLAPRWRALPPARRRVLLRHLRALRRMTPRQRQRALHNAKFFHGLDANERDLLQRLSAIRLRPGPGL